MKRLYLKIAFFLTTVTSIVLILTGSAQAAFNHNNLMDDFVFDNVGAMSAAQIDSWLNSNFPSSCISINHGFSAPDPTGYSPSGGYTYGGNVSAGRVIYDAAQAYSINPQVLLATLQKEQSLVSGGSGCSTLAYTGAMGYGCPDGGTTYSYSGVNLYSINGSTVSSVSGTCVNSSSKAGFSQQVIHGAWLLKFGEQRSEGNTGWAVIKGNWDNSDDPPTCYGGPMTQGNRKRCSSDSTPVFYDGNITIDGSTTHMDTGPTAALYWYTPHFNGNQNFVNIYTSWFGTIYANYGWYTTGYKVLDKTGSFYVDPGNLQPGEKYLVDMVATNTGNATWTNDGPTPVRLGSANWAGHDSGLCDPNSWLWCGRPTALKEASVAPGGIGHFDFLIQVPYTPGFYRDWFKPVAENLRWFNDSDQSLGIRVVSPGTYSWYTTGFRVLDQAGNVYLDPGNLRPNTKYYIDMAVTNTGTAIWTNSGPIPVRLGTANWGGHNSGFCDPATWLWCGRPVTLREASVAPGQYGHFNFLILTPPNPGAYRDWFKPVVEQYTWMSDSDQSLGIIVQP